MIAVLRIRMNQHAIRARPVRRKLRDKDQCACIVYRLNLCGKLLDVDILLLQLRQKGKNLFLRQIERSRHCNAADANILPMQIDLGCALLRHAANIRLGTLDLALGIPILLHRGMCTHTTKADTACQ